MESKHFEWRVIQKMCDDFDFAPLWCVQYKKRWWIFTWWKTLSKHYHRENAIQKLKQLIRE